MGPPIASWTITLKPLTDRLDLCAKMDMELVESPDGCAAWSKLMKEMAKIIDEEIVARTNFKLGPAR